MLSVNPEQRTQEGRAIRQVLGLVVDYFDFVALQYGDIHELFGFDEFRFCNISTYRYPQTQPTPGAAGTHDRRPNRSRANKPWRRLFVNTSTFTVCLPNCFAAPREGI